MSIRSVGRAGGFAAALTLLSGCGLLTRSTLVRTRDPSFTAATAPGPTVVTAAQNCISVERYSPRPGGPDRPNNDEATYPTPVARFEAVIGARASMEHAETGASFAKAMCGHHEDALRALIKKAAAASGAASVLVPTITNNATCWQVKRDVIDPGTGQVIGQVETDKIKCGPMGLFYEVALYDAEGKMLWGSSEYRGANSRKSNLQIINEVLADLPVAGFAPGGATADE
jgi:hypothetical protein